MKKRIVFILSSSYSGSHYLSLLLGSHSRAKHVGELRRLTKNTLSDLDKGRELDMSADPVLEGITKDDEDRIFDILFSRFGEEIDVIADTSKSHNKWARRFIRNEKYDLRFIHLIRDPRAMLRRWRKSTYFLKNLTTKKRLCLYNKSWLPRLLLAKEDTLLNYRWVMENLEIRKFILENDLNYKLVTYHDLAKDPSVEVARLTEWLGLSYEPEQLEYWNFDHIGTQKKAYTNVSSKEQCSIDLRWKSELEEDEIDSVLRIRAVQQLASDFNLQFGEDGLIRNRELDE